MGQVFHGVHVEQRVPVAIKVLTSRLAHDREYRASFKAEVQSVAGLDHPGIVMVFDMGTISAEIERKTEGALVRGAPYLVMEYIGGGSLQKAWRGLPWKELRTGIFGLLDALAHAHARGVIHRDIKPANILLSAKADVRQGIKLSDFGIAHAMNFKTRPGEVEDAYGTPEYMSPEQYMGRWREYGPWTDLYSLGCVTYQLLAGHLPFVVKPGQNPVEILSRAHLYEDLPLLKPRYPAPDGIEAWLHKLTAKAPWDRFQCAADAAQALIEVESAWVPPLSVGPLRPVAEEACVTLSFARVSLKTAASVGKKGSVTLKEAPQGGEASGVRPVEAKAPPLPESWREEADELPLKLQGVGLGLYGLRTLRLMGREAERDALWAKLAAVHEEGLASLVVLRGPAGVGKSRLAQWLCQRTEELGAAIPMHALHNPIPGPADGVPRMLAAAFRCTGLSPEKAHERIRRYLRSHDALHDETTAVALARIVLPSWTWTESEDDSLPSLRFNTAAERYAVILRTLAAMGRTRPVLLWLDDVQWGSDALGLAAYILKARLSTPAPILMVLTARDEALAQRPVEWHMLTELSSLDGALRRDLGPLNEAEHADLVRQLLHLSGDLAREVIERTAGNPLFAIQLVGDWVQRGVLEVAETGFVLAKGERAVLPDDLYDLWAEHLTRLLQDHPGHARIALELASALGQEVDQREWATASKQLGVPLPEEVVDTLIDERLAYKTESGWGFVHGMLRESLERQAIEAGRWTRLQRACALMLQRHYPAYQEGIAERLGRHLLEGEEYAEAMAPLLKAAEEQRQQSSYDKAIELVELREKAMAHLSATSEASPELCEGWILRAEIGLNRGHTDEANQWIERLSEAAEAGGWRAQGARALLLQARLASQRGDLDRADVLATEALTHHEALSDPDGEGQCLLVLGDVAYWRQSLSQSQRCYEQALALFRTSHNRQRLGEAFYSLGCVYAKRRMHNQARYVFDQGLEVADALGNRLLRAVILHGVAEDERTQGELTSAEAHYREVHRLLSDIGSAREVHARLHISLTLLAQERYHDATEILAEAAAAMETFEEPRAQASYSAQLMVCASQRAERRHFERHLTEVNDHTQAASLSDPDVAWCAQRAGELWTPRSVDRARRAYLFARRHWAALGRDQEVTQVEDALSALFKP